MSAGELEGDFVRQDGSHADHYGLGRDHAAVVRNYIELYGWTNNGIRWPEKKKALASLEELVEHLRQLEIHAGELGGRDRLREHTVERLEAENNRLREALFTMPHVNGDQYHHIKQALEYGR